jgi:hypothetical protein
MLISITTGWQETTQEFFAIGNCPSLGHYMESWTHYNICNLISTEWRAVGKEYIMLSLKERFLAVFLERHQMPTAFFIIQPDSFYEDDRLQATMRYTTYICTYVCTQQR